jgi:acyl-CoA hydrolase
MPQRISAQEWPALLCPDERVFMPGCSGESPLLLEALAARPDCARDVTFTGMFIPGINRFDYAALTLTTRLRSYFANPDWRTGFDAGRIDLVPLSYWQAFHDLAGQRIDTAVLHVTPPNAQGQCSMGVAADFAPAVMQRARRRIAHVNPLMPRPRHAPTIAWADLDLVIEAPGPLRTVSTPPVTAPVAAIARHIASLIGDGDTLQLGVGNVQRGVLEACAGKSDLHIHSGMISDALMPLAASGALADGVAVTCGVALGEQALYDWCHDNPSLRFAPVSHTHDGAVLRQISSFRAINSAIEVDLFGQANLETMEGRLVSAPGGATDFLRGARASPGGLAILALKSTAAGGRQSRIVPQLAGRLVSLARTDADVIVTENGIARVGALGLDDRAAALIGIAAIEHQPLLQEAWTLARRAL